MPRKVRQAGVSGHTPTADQRIRAVAARQRDLVTLEQLRHAGLSNGAIARRVDAGTLIRVFRGVYTVSQARLSPETRGFAAVLACGPGAGLSHFAGATVYGVSRFRSPLIDVVSPRKRTLEGVRVHYVRTLDRTDVTTIRGIPVTTFARLQLDLADVLTPFQLANVLHQAAYKGIPIFMPEANGRHNAKTLRRAYELHHSGSAGTRSTAEDVFLTLGLPEPLVNVVYLGFEVDFRWPDRLVAVEVDGPHHGRPYDRASDIARDAALRSDGYIVLRFSADEVQQCGADVAQRVLDALSVRPAP
jgi:hypothetical protein